MWLPWIRTTQVPWVLHKSFTWEQYRQDHAEGWCRAVISPPLEQSPLQDLYLSLPHAPNPCSTHCSITWSGWSRAGCKMYLVSDHQQDSGSMQDRDCRRTVLDKITDKHWRKLKDNNIFFSAQKLQKIRQVKINAARVAAAFLANSW